MGEKRQKLTVEIFADSNHTLSGALQDIADMIEGGTLSGDYDYDGWFGEYEVATQCLEGQDHIWVLSRRADDGTRFVRCKRCGHEEEC